MNADEFERLIGGYPLRFDRHYRDGYVEHIRLPAMIEIYWQLVERGRAPPQDTFSDAVVGATNVEPALRPAVRYRAQKAYPAFVREHHAELVLTERFRWVFKAPPRDFDGIDLLVVREDRQAVGLDLTVATPGAEAWHGVKIGRHRYDAPFPVVALYANPEYRAGSFFLHRPGDLIAAVESVENEYWRQRADALAAMGDDAYRSGERRPKASRRDFLDGFRAAGALIRGWARA